MRLLRNAIIHYKKYGAKSLLISIFIFIIERYIYLINFIRSKLKYLKVNSNFVVIDVNDYKMIVNLDDKGLSRDLIIDGTREYIATQMMKKILKKGDIVIDIGANIGYYVILESKLVGHEGVVYAIEPVPLAVELLRRNCELNKCKNVKIYQLAIYNRSGKLTIYVPSKLNWSTINIENVKDIKRNSCIKIEVNALTLEDFIQKEKIKPTLIRMDVEGAEFEILTSSEKLLRKLDNIMLFVEFHFNILGRDKSMKLLRMLKLCGFDVLAVIYDIKDGMLSHKILLKILKKLWELKGIPKPFDVMYLQIDDILSNKSILDGKWGALEIFFVKKSRNKDLIFELKDS